MKTTHNRWPTSVNMRLAVATLVLCLPFLAAATQTPLKVLIDCDPTNQCVGLKAVTATQTTALICFSLFVCVCILSLSLSLSLFLSAGPRPASTLTTTWRWCGRCRCTRTPRAPSRCWGCPRPLATPTRTPPLRLRWRWCRPPAPATPCAWPTRGRRRRFYATCWPACPQARQ